MNEISEWMLAHTLKLNSEKTKFVLCGSKNNHRIANPDSSNLTVNGISIALSDNACNLGVFFDSAMKMTDNVTNICRISYVHLRNIRKIRHLLDFTTCHYLVLSLVVSRLDYCNSLMYNLPQYLIRKMQCVQNSAARILTNTARHSHITPVLKSLHWLPIRIRISFKLLCFAFKALYSPNSPEYLKKLLSPYDPPRPLRSSGAKLLNVPRINNSYGQRAFSVAASKLWNDIPAHIRSSTSLATFKTKLKTHLYNTY